MADMETTETDKKPDATNKSDLLEALKKIINDYEDAIKWKKGEIPSTQDIATEVGVSYPTVNNIKKGTAKYISHDMVVKISTKLGGPMTISGILKFAEKNNLNLPKDEIRKEHQQMLHYSLRNRDFLDIALQTRYQMILLAASTTTGITEEGVIHNFGMVGKKDLDFLIEKGMIVKKEDGRLYGDSKSVGLFEIEDVRRCFQTVISRFKGKDDDPSNSMSIQSKSVNKKFQKVVHEKVKEFFEFINREARKPENIGNEKIAIGAVAYKFFDNPKELDDNDNNHTKGMIQ